MSRVTFRHISRVATDNDRQLGLRVNPTDPPRKEDGSAVRRHGGGGLEKKEGFRRKRFAPLAGVVAKVEAHPDDLARLNRRK